MQPLSSLITGVLSESESTGKKPNEDGRQPSERALTRSQPNGELSTAVMHPAVLRRDPEANTEAVLSRLASLSLKVSVKRRLTFPSDQSAGDSQTWREVVDRAEIEVGPNPDFAAAHAALAESMAPATDHEIGIWLVELSTVSARRSESAEEAALTITAYTKRLRGYPGDIVRDTLQAWSGKWFPTWGELKDILDVRTAPRAFIRTSLSVHQAATAGPQRPDLTGLNADQRYEKLMLAARHARRTDPDFAKELEDEAGEQLALANEEH
jgi:hypothetical protein